MVELFIIVKSIRTPFLYTLILSAAPFKSKPVNCNWPSEAVILVTSSLNKLVEEIFFNCPVFLSTVTTSSCVISPSCNPIIESGLTAEASITVGFISVPPNSMVVPVLLVIEVRPFSAFTFKVVPELLPAAIQLVPL